MTDGSKDKTKVIVVVRLMAMFALLALGAIIKAEAHKSSHALTVETHTDTKKEVVAPSTPQYEQDSEMTSFGQMAGTEEPLMVDNAVIMQEAQDSSELERQPRAKKGRKRMSVSRTLPFGYYASSSEQDGDEDKRNSAENIKISNSIKE